MKFKSISSGVVLYDSIAGGQQVPMEFEHIYNALMRTGVVYARDIEMTTYSYGQLLKTSFDELETLKRGDISYRKSFYLYRYGIKLVSSDVEYVTLFDINPPTTLKSTKYGNEVPDYTKSGKSNVKRYTVDNGIMRFLEKIRISYMATDLFSLPNGVSIEKGTGSSVKPDARVINGILKSISTSSYIKPGDPASFIRAFRSDIDLSDLKDRLVKHKIEKVPEDVKLCFCEIRYVENGFEVALSDAIYSGTKLLVPSTLEVPSHTYTLDNIAAVVNDFVDYVADVGAVRAPAASSDIKELERIITQNLNVNPPLSEQAVKSMYYALKDNGLKMDYFMLILADVELFKYCNVCKALTPHNEVASDVYQCLFCNTIEDKKGLLNKDKEEGVVLPKVSQHLQKRSKYDEILKAVDDKIKDSDESESEVNEIYQPEPELSIEEQAQGFNIPVSEYKKKLSKPGVFFRDCRFCNDVTPHTKVTVKDRAGNSVVANKCEICNRARR